MVLLSNRLFLFILSSCMRAFLDDIVCRISLSKIAFYAYIYKVTLCVGHTMIIALSARDEMVTKGVWIIIC